METLQLTHIVPTPELLDVARRVVWFKEPEDALKNPAHFLAHVMTHGTLTDVVTVQKSVPVGAFREALEHAPPGVFDARSWHYWNLKLGRNPVPLMPVRKLEAGEEAA